MSESYSTPTFGDPDLFDNPWRNSQHTAAILSQPSSYGTSSRSIITPIASQGPLQTASRSSSLYGNELVNNVPNRVQQPTGINRPPIILSQHQHSNEQASFYDGNSGTPEDFPSTLSKPTAYNNQRANAQQPIPVPRQLSLYRTSSQKLKSHVSPGPTYTGSHTISYPTVSMSSHAASSRRRLPSTQSTSDSTYMAKNPFHTPIHKKSTGFSFDDINAQAHVIPSKGLSAEPGGHNLWTGAYVPRYLSRSPTRFLTSSPETLRSGHATDLPHIAHSSVTHGINISQPLETEYYKGIGELPRDQSTQLKGASSLPMTVTPLAAKNHYTPPRQYSVESVGGGAAAEMLEHVRNISNSEHQPSKTRTNQTQFVPENKVPSIINHVHIQQSAATPSTSSNSPYIDGRSQYTVPHSPVPSLHRTAPQRQTSRASRRSTYISSPPVTLPAHRPTSPIAHATFPRTKTPSRKSTMDSVYVANNPFRKQTFKNSESDYLTFDDIDIQDQTEDVSADMGGVDPVSSYPPHFPDPGRYNNSTSLPHTPNTHLNLETMVSNLPANYYGGHTGQYPAHFPHGYLPGGTSLPVTPATLPPVFASPVGGYPSGNVHLNNATSGIPAEPIHPPKPDHGNKEGFWSIVGNHLRWPTTGVPFKSEVAAHSNGDAQEVMLTDLEKIQYSNFIVTFIVLILPRQIYLHLLLRLPSLYFSRVSRIFEETRLTMAEIKEMAIQTTSHGTAQTFDGLSIELTTGKLPPQYEKLKVTWELFIESVMREWKTFNVVSVLLLSAILTILQISDAAEDVVTRYTALLSLICALISLLFGCLYIIRFGSMRKTYRAAEWAMEGQRTNTAIWWNVWVLLAMPAIWLTWSILLYIACIMSFIWRTSTQSNGNAQNLSSSGLLAVRIVISAILGLGIVYGALILSTFSRYGEAMDHAWQGRIDGWIKAKIASGYSSNRPSAYNTPSGPPPAIIQEDDTQSVNNNWLSPADDLPTLGHHGYTLPNRNETLDVHNTPNRTHEAQNPHEHATHEFRDADSQNSLLQGFVGPQTPGVESSILLHTSGHHRRQPLVSQELYDKMLQSKVGGTSSTVFNPNGAPIEETGISRQPVIYGQAQANSNYLLGRDTYQAVLHKAVNSWSEDDGGVLTSPISMPRAPGEGPQYIPPITLPRAPVIQHIPPIMDMPRAPGEGPRYIPPTWVSQESVTYGLDSDFTRAPTARGTRVPADNINHHSPLAVFSTIPEEEEEEEEEEDGEGYYRSGLTFQRSTSTDSYEISVEPPSRPASILVEDEVQDTYTLLTPEYKPIPLPQVELTLPQSYEILTEPTSPPLSILIEMGRDTDFDPNSPIQHEIAPDIPDNLVQHTRINRDKWPSTIGWGDPSRTEVFQQGSSRMTSGPPGGSGGESKSSPDARQSSIWTPIPIAPNSSNLEDDVDGFDAITIHNTQINATVSPPTSKKKKGKKYS